MLPHAADEANVFIGQFRGRVVIRYGQDTLDYLPGGITGLVKGLRKLSLFCARSASKRMRSMAPIAITVTPTGFEVMLNKEVPKGQA